MMVMGCAFSCLEPILAVVTALDYKSPFHLTSKVREFVGAALKKRLSAPTDKKRVRLWSRRLKDGGYLLLRNTAILLFITPGNAVSSTNFEVSKKLQSSVGLSLFHIRSKFLLWGTCI